MEGKNDLEVIHSNERDGELLYTIHMRIDTLLRRIASAALRGVWERWVSLRKQLAAYLRGHRRLIQGLRQWELMRSRYYRLDLMSRLA